MRALSLFSGIGGLDLAAHAAGVETVAFCEIEPFAVQVLERRFPAVENHGDITRFTNRTLRELGGSPFHRFKCPADYNGTIDVVHGGFPCQDLSVAGKQKGLSGERSGLWFEMLRVISEIRPSFVLAENVRGAVNLALDTVYSGLVGEGYKVYPYVIPASAVGAPHQRERLFVVGVRKDVADSASERLHGCFSEESFECGGENGRYISVEGSGFGLWPTPSVHGNYNRRGLSENSGDGLATAVKLWPTPKRQNANGGPCRHGDGGIDLQTAANGTLNPAWVEILMGFPLGWTDLDCDEPEPWPGWPAMMGERLWMTPKGGACGMTAKTKGRPLEMATHLSTQTFVAERDYADQHPYEPPRTIKKCNDRAKRLQCLGNAVVPAQARPFFEAMAIMEEVRTQCNVEAVEE